MKNDSAKYYFDKLTHKKPHGSIELKSVISFFEKNHFPFCLLAITAHWNPDARVYSIRAIKRRIEMRPMIFTTKAGYAELAHQDTIITSFLIYLMEHNPLFIPGSENSTIHGNYLSNILLTLDLYTKEEIMQGKSI